MKIRNIALGFGLVPMALIIAGCGGGDDTGATSLPSASADASAPAAPAEAPADKTATEVTADTLGASLLDAYRGANELTKIADDSSLEDGLTQIKAARDYLQSASTSMSGPVAAGLPADKVAEASSLTGQLSVSLDKFADCTADAGMDDALTKCAEQAEGMTDLAEKTGVALDGLVDSTSLTEDQILDALGY